MPRETGRHLIYGVFFDPDQREITGPGGRAKLTPMESSILHLLSLHEGQVLSDEFIMEHIDYAASDVKPKAADAIKYSVRCLREKISSLPGHPQPLQLLPGVGYRLN